jgi:hypothetical protein
MAIWEKLGDIFCMEIWVAIPQLQAMQFGIGQPVCRNILEMGVEVYKVLILTIADKATHFCKSIHVRQLEIRTCSER